MDYRLFKKKIICWMRGHKIIVWHLLGQPPQVYPVCERCKRDCSRTIKSKNPQYRFCSEARHQQVTKTWEEWRMKSNE